MFKAGDKVCVMNRWYGTVVKVYEDDEEVEVQLCGVMSVIYDFSDVRKEN